MIDTKILVTQRGLFEVHDANALLVDLLLDCALLWPEETMEVGDVNRTEAEEVAAGALTRVHSAGKPHRAADVRVRTLGPTDAYEPADQAQADAVCRAINAVWMYNDNVPGKGVAYGALHGRG